MTILLVAIFMWIKLDGWICIIASACFLVSFWGPLILTLFSFKYVSIVVAHLNVNMVGAFFIPIFSLSILWVREHRKLLFFMVSLLVGNATVLLDVARFDVRSLWTAPPRTFSFLHTSIVIVLLLIGTAVTRFFIWRKAKRHGRHRLSRFLQGVSAANSAITLGLLIQLFVSVTVAVDYWHNLPVDWPEYNGAAALKFLLLVIVTVAFPVTAYDAIRQFDLIYIFTGTHVVATLASAADQCFSRQPLVPLPTWVVGVGIVGSLVMIIGCIVLTIAEFHKIEKPDLDTPGWTRMIQEGSDGSEQLNDDY